MKEQIHRIVQENAGRIIDFCQRLICTPSLSGQEGAAARLVVEEMRNLGYDSVEIDACGNVLGTVNGQGGKRVVFNGHMDIVAVGDAARWKHAPFGAEIVDGWMWGRGTSDMKAGLAAQIYAAALLKSSGLPFAGEIVATAAVNEEVGGLGSRIMSGELTADVVIIGEASNNMLMRGHRGRYEILVTFRGVPAHASAPQLGVNPHYAMSRFLLQLVELEMCQESVLGNSTVSPTLMQVPGSNANVIPESVTVHLDWRPVPTDVLEGVLARLRDLAAACCDEGGSYDVRIRQEEIETYTGYKAAQPAVLAGFLQDAASPMVQRAHLALETQLDRTVDIGVWHFATDGSHFASAGMPCLGFGPGDPRQAHMIDERIEVREILEAVEGYMALALALG